MGCNRHGPAFVRTAVLALLAIGAATGAHAADPPATAPAAAAGELSPEMKKKIRIAIFQLGEADFAIREEAEKFLWSLGDRAIPALREATESDDPEVARRAKLVLENFAYGIRPDTPKEVIDLLEQYRAANDPRQKQTALSGLARLEAPGARVLLKLAREERDEMLRGQAMQLLSGVLRQVGAQLVAAGELSSIEQMLRTCSVDGADGARDLAAFLKIQGGTKEEIARLEKLNATLQRAGEGGAAGDQGALHSPDAQFVPTRIAILYRAEGDLPAAARWAREAGEIELLRAVLAEQGNYADLAKVMEDRGVVDGDVADVGYLTAYHRLAGNTEAADKWAAKLVAYAKENPTDHWSAVEALLLNDRVDEALKILTTEKNYTGLMEFLNPRMQVAEAVDLYEQAKAAAATDLAKIRLQAAPALHFMGRGNEARDLIADTAKGEYGAPDFATWLQLIEAARSIGMPREQLEGWCIEAIASAGQRQPGVPGPPDNVSRVFDKAGFARGEDAAVWWQTLRDHHAGESQAKTFERLRRLDQKQWSADELKDLAEETRRRAVNLPPGDRDRRLVLAAETLALNGQAAIAIDVLGEMLRQSDAPSAKLALADLLASAGQWEQAAEAYETASQHAGMKGNPLPVLLRGWALVKAGKEEAGRRLLDTAYLMPLGNEMLRHSVMMGVLERQAALLKKPDPLLEAEAARHRDMILRCGDGSTWHWADATRRAAEVLNEKGDHLGAAAGWDRAFLSNFSTSTSFIEPTANLTIPVLIHRVRAQGLAKAGKVDKAVALAALCLKSTAGDADSQIEIVNALKEAGHAEQADVVYKRAAEVYDAMRRKYPESAQAHNLIAWLQSRCQRDLDAALANAKRGVELQPTSTAIIDTLSEVYFARGEYGHALELNAQNIAAEPNVEHHKKNRTRFLAAQEKAGKGD